MIRHKTIALLLGFSLVVLGVASIASAAQTTVDTTLDESTSYLISDPDVGDYTVTISGHSAKTQHENRFYFRTSSSSSPVDQTWQISVTGLNEGEAITDLVLNTTRIVPTVGGGSNWSWDIDLSADVAGGGSFMDHRDLDGDLTVDPDIAFTDELAGGHFGENPTFFVNVSKSNSNTRALGWYDFAITAIANAPVLGDTDGDGIVEASDLDPIRMNYRTVQTARTAGDLVDDDFIDFKDFRQWKTGFLAAGGSLVGLETSFLAAPVPEPATGWLIAWAGLFFCRRRIIQELQQPLNTSAERSSFAN